MEQNQIAFDSQLSLKQFSPENGAVQNIFRMFYIVCDS